MTFRSICFRNSANSPLWQPSIIQRPTVIRDTGLRHGWVLNFTHCWYPQSDSNRHKHWFLRPGALPDLPESCGHCTTIWRATTGFEPALTQWARPIQGDPTSRKPIICLIVSALQERLQPPNGWYFKHLDSLHVFVRTPTYPESYRNPKPPAVASRQTPDYTKLKHSQDRFIWYCVRDSNPCSHLERVAT